MTLPFIDSEDKAKEAVLRINSENKNSEYKPIIFSTLVKEDLRQIVREIDGLILDIFDVFIGPLEKELNQKSVRKTGLAHGMSDTKNYMKRIEATNYALSNDDGGVIKHYDMADIIQNLKSVRFKLSDSDVDNVEVSLKGKKVFTAADIQKATDQFEVLNQDQYITEVNTNGKFEIELRIGVGKGYVPSEENELPNAPIGTLAMDSIFNPVTKVTYNVQPVPGAKDPIEILSVEVETDGSVTPQDAISYSATVLMDHLKLVEAIAKPEVLEVTEKISEEIIKVRNLLNLTIDEMELSVRSHNCLQAAGIKHIYELVSKEESEMLKYKNFGRKSLTELVEKLDDMGISFGMDVDKYLKLEV